MLQFCVCRSKSSFRDDNNLHVTISVLGEALAGKTIFRILYLRVRAAECDITIRNGA